MVRLSGLCVVALCLGCALMVAASPLRLRRTSAVTTLGPSLQTCIRIRGGVTKSGQGKASAAKKAKAGKKAKLVKITPVTYVRAFFASMFDPSYDDQFIEKPVHTVSGTASLKKEKKGKFD